MKVKFGFGAVFICCVVLAACGSSNSGSSSSGGGSGGASSTTGGGGVKVEGAKVIDPKSLDNPPKGTVKYCQGKDTTGAGKAIVKEFNAKYARAGLQGHADRVPGVGRPAAHPVHPAPAGQVRRLRRLQLRRDLDGGVRQPEVAVRPDPLRQQAQKSKYIAAPLETVHYAGKYWGVPETSDAAFIYYRTDKGGGTPPATWQQVYADAKPQGGIVYQGAPYEGLTCDYLELAFAAGGTVLNDDGKKSTINSPQNIKALQLMVDGIKDGSAPKAVTTYMEPETDQAWTSGKYAYMRNWTYAYAADNKSPSKVKGKYKVAPLPTFEGGGKAGILGGHNSVISAYTKNPGLALKFSDFYASPGVPEEAPAASTRRRRSSRAPTARRTSRRRSRTRRSSCRRSARPRPARSRRSIRRSRRRSTRTSTTRSPVARARRTR